MTAAQAEIRLETDLVEAWRAEQRQQLMAAVNELPEEQRTVISLRYFVGLSEREVAETLGVREGTVKSRTSRALDRLREAYD